MKAAKRQFLVTVEGIAQPWMTKTGGDKTAGTNKVYDGGSLIPQVIAGPAEVGDITVTKAYDPEQDQDLVTRLLAQVGQWSTTVSVASLLPDMSAAKVKPRVYSGMLTGVKEPETDAGAGDASTIELTFAISSVS